MADNAAVSEALKVLGFVFGGGGLATVVVAYLNRKPPPLPIPPAPPPPSLALEPPWLIQTVKRIQMDIEGIKEAVDTLTAQSASTAIQINTATAVRRRRPRAKSRK